jgi:hypothetical protein
MLKPTLFLLSSVIFSLVLSDNRGVSQTPSGQNSNLTSSSGQDQALNSTSVPVLADTRVKVLVQRPPVIVPMSRSTSPFSTVGFAFRAGLGGSGFDVATPMTSRFNLRAGADFFSFSNTFAEEGADVDASLRMRSGHFSLDWFPFGGSFRLSPLVVFANNNLARGTAIIPPGSTVTLSGQDYVSSLTDPLHGSGSIGFRKVAPGFTLGFGNIIPRTRGHFSFPVEAGFYYVGQPTLKVAFTGSACDPTVSESIGCESVDKDADFQKSLAAFIARNNNNLSYASFFPIFSVGFGFTF